MTPRLHRVTIAAVLAGLTLLPAPAALDAQARRAAADHAARHRQSAADAGALRPVDPDRGRPAGGADRRRPRQHPAALRDRTARAAHPPRRRLLHPPPLRSRGRAARPVPHRVGLRPGDAARDLRPARHGGDVPPPRAGLRLRPPRSAPPTKASPPPARHWRPRTSRRAWSSTRTDCGSPPSPSITAQAATPAYGYRVDYQGRSAAFSGDTRYFEPLVEHARGVDVLVHEVIAPEVEMRRAQVQGAAALERIVARHASPGAGRDRSSRASSRGSASTRTSCPSPTTAEDLDCADAAHLRRAAGGRLRPDDHRHRRRRWRSSRAGRCPTSDRAPPGRPCRLATWPTGTSTPVLSVLADLQSIFGTRLQAFVVYAPARTPRPSVADRAVARAGRPRPPAPRAPARWQRDGAATPVVLTRREFARSLDAFPVEFGEIIDDPRDALRRRPVRRACRSRPPTCAAPARARRGRCCCTCARTTWRRPATSRAVDGAGRRLGARLPRAHRACWPASTGAGSSGTRAGGLGGRAAGPRSPRGLRRAARRQRSPTTSTRRCRCASSRPIWPRSSSSRRRVDEW